jgi:hypothetical protein
MRHFTLVVMQAVQSNATATHPRECQYRIERKSGQLSTLRKLLMTPERVNQPVRTNASSAQSQTFCAACRGCRTHD